MKIKVIDKKGIYGRDQEPNEQVIKGVIVKISPEGYHRSKMAVFMAVKTMLAYGQLDPKDIISIEVFETSIYIDSANEDKIKSGVYKIAQAQTEMERTDGSSGTGIQYELVSAKTEDSLYENIHAKRKRIEKGSGERMRRPGEKGRPTKEDFKNAAKTAKK